MIECDTYRGVQGVYLCLHVLQTHQLKYVTNTGVIRLFCKSHKRQSLAQTFHVSTGGEWTVLSEDVTDSCYVAKDLPRGASYVFRVGCVTKMGAGPFSDASAPVVMATHPEGKRNAVCYWTLYRFIISCHCYYAFFENMVQQLSPVHLCLLYRDPHSSHSD